jgi:hypothetical protein
VFVRFASGGGYFINKSHILRSESDFSLLHEQPFHDHNNRDFATISNNHGDIYNLANIYQYIRHQKGLLHIDAVTVAQRYNGNSIVPVEIKFAPFQYKSSGFAAQNLLAENNDLYILARTYDDGNDRSADYQLLKTHNDGVTYTQQTIIKDNTSALLYYLARAQGSTFVIGNDQQTSETLIYCAQ